MAISQEIHLKYHSNFPGANKLNNWVIFFQNVILFSDIVHYNCNISVWNWSNDYLINTVDTDGLVLYHQGISSFSAEYAPMHFQSFMG